MEKSPCGRWQTTTFLGALRAEGFIAPLTVEGAINRSVFRAWVMTHSTGRQIWNDCLPTGFRERCLPHDWAVKIALRRLMSCPASSVVMCWIAVSDARLTPSKIICCIRRQAPLGTLGWAVTSAALSRRRKVGRGRCRSRPESRFHAVGGSDDSGRNPCSLRSSVGRRRVRRGTQSSALSRSLGNHDDGDRLEPAQSRT